MATEKSSVIVGASTNLLGFSLVVISTMKASGFNVTSIIDEITGVASVFLGLSCLLSFLAINNSSESLSIRYEGAAVKFFTVSLIILFITILMIAFSICL